jgi:hypothetical protein
MLTADASGDVQILKLLFMCASCRTEVYEDVVDIFPSSLRSSLSTMAPSIIVDGAQLKEIQGAPDRTASTS